jgi:hypothetical protein
MKPQLRIARAILLSLMASFLFGFVPNTPDLSGTWIINTRLTRLIKRYQPEPGLNPSQIDPGIG